MATGSDGTSVVGDNSTTSCDSHRSKAVDRYCEDCEVLGCVLCMKYEHPDHDWKQVREIQQNIRWKFSKNLLETKHTWLPLLEGRRNRLMENKPETGKPLTNGMGTSNGIESPEVRPKQPAASELERAVDKKADDMIALIESYRKRLKKQIHYLYDGKEEIKEDNIEELDFDISYLKSFIADCESVNKQGSEVEVIRTNQALEEVLRRFEINYSKASNESPYFRDGKLSVGALEYMFGSIEEMSPSADEFQYVSAIVSSVYSFGEDDVRLCAINENEAWVNDNGDTMHYLVHKDGYPTKNVDFEFCTQSFGKSLEGEIYVVDYAGKWVKKVRPDGSLQDLFRTAPLFPVVVCLNENGHLLLALTDKPIDSEGSRQSFITEMTKQGEEVRKLTFSSDDITNRITSIRSLDISGTGEFIVIDMFAAVEGRVCTLTVNGDIKHAYNGSSKLDVEFNPVQTCCDESGRILVSDVNNDVIHLLNQNAELLQLLFADDETVCSPISISLYGNSLWIGCKSGEVIHVEYHNLEENSDAEISNVN